MEQNWYVNFINIEHYYVNKSDYDKCMPEIYMNSLRLIDCVSNKYEKLKNNIVTVNKDSEVVNSSATTDYGSQSDYEIEEAEPLYPTLLASNDSSKISRFEFERRIARGEILQKSDINFDKMRYINDNEYIERMTFSTKLITEGRAMYAKKDYITANTLFTQGINLVKNVKSANKQKNDKLIAMYESFVKNKVLSCANIYLYSEALNSCNEFLKVYKNNIKILYFKGYILFHLQEFNEARNIFNFIYNSTIATECEKNSALSRLKIINKQNKLAARKFQKLFSFNNINLYEQNKENNFVANKEIDRNASETSISSTQIRKDIKFKKQSEYDMINLNELIIMLKKLIHSAIEYTTIFENEQINADYKELAIIKNLQKHLKIIMMPIFDSHSSTIFNGINTFNDRKIYLNKLILYFRHCDAIDKRAKEAITVLANSLRSIVLLESYFE